MKWAKKAHSLELFKYLMYNNLIKAEKDSFSFLFNNFQVLPSDVILSNILVLIANRYNARGLIQKIYIHILFMFNNEYKLRKCEIGKFVKKKIAYLILIRIQFNR